MDEKGAKEAISRRPRADKAGGKSEVLATIAVMPESDRAIAERLHTIIKAKASALSPRLWYGMVTRGRSCLHCRS
jgi:hypothetical protein